MNATPPERQPLIAHLVWCLATGGVEKGVVTLINRMPADRYRHAVIAITRIEDYARRIERPDVELVALDKRPGKDFALYARLRKVLRRMRPDILHSRNLGTLDAQWVARLCGVPVRIHGENGRDTYDLDGTSFRYNLLRRATRSAIHRYSAVSRDLAEWLARTVHVPRGRIHQIYNGVDSRNFHPRNGPRALEGAAGVIGEDSFVVGTVGRMAEVKDQLTLVEAFLELLAARPALRPVLRLAIVGGGPLRETCLERVERAGASGLAWLPGERSDIPEVMRAMDLFVLPSLAEGISNTILEAMASGLPVLATRTGGNPELVGEGKTGGLFPVGDSRALAAAVAQYCDNPSLARAHGEAGRLTVEARFTLETMVRGYCDLYDAALAEAGWGG